LVLLIVAGGARAAITQVGSQALFSTLGTITQNTNWDAYGQGWTFPGDDFVVGDLTFVAGGQNVIGGTGTWYNTARNLLTDNYIQGTTVMTANTYNLYAVNAGNFFGNGAETFNIFTNLGNYSFSESLSDASNLAPLTFIGFEAGPGEYFTSVTWSDAYATGVTDIQLGTVAVVPEPGSYAMLLAGLGLLGFMARRIKRKVN
jgi:hypothetical protein